MKKSQYYTLSLSVQMHVTASATLFLAFLHTKMHMVLFAVVIGVTEIISIIVAIVIAIIGK